MWFCGHPKCLETRGNITIFADKEQKYIHDCYFHCSEADQLDTGFSFLCQASGCNQLLPRLHKECIKIHIDQAHSESAEEHDRLMHAMYTENNEIVGQPPYEMVYDSYDICNEYVFDTPRSLVETLTPKLPFIETELLKSMREAIEVEEEWYEEHDVKAEFPVIVDIGRDDFPPHLTMWDYRYMWVERHRYMGEDIPEGRRYVGFPGRGDKLDQYFGTLII